MEIETSGRDVCGDEQSTFTFIELVEGDLTFLLGNVTVPWRRKVFFSGSSSLNLLACIAGCLWR